MNQTEFAAFVRVSKMTISRACKPGGRLDGFFERDDKGNVTIKDPEAARRHFHAQTDLTKAPPQVMAAKAQLSAEEIAAFELPEEDDCDEEDDDTESKAEKKPTVVTPFAGIADDSRRAKHWDANLKELKYREAAKELISRASVVSQLKDVFTEVRTKLLGVPSRAKQSMPELSIDQVTKLDELIREALTELAPPESLQ